MAGSYALTRRLRTTGILTRMRLITAAEVPTSLARVHEPTETPVRVGLVQHAWDADGDQLRATLHDGIRTAADAGARIVFLPELTLSRYPADALPTGRPDATAESLDDGPTVTFAPSRALLSTSAVGWIAVTVPAARRAAPPRRRRSRRPSRRP